MTGFLTAVLCGICNSLGGIGCKVGDNGGVHMVQTSVFLGVAGTFFFGMRACLNSEFANAPWEVWTIAAIVGLLQYLGMILLQKGLQSGSLSLVWCANCLGFMPALLFAHFVYGEPLAWNSVISLFLIFGAIVSASFGGKSSVEEKKKFSFSFALNTTLNHPPRSDRAEYYTDEIKRYRQSANTFWLSAVRSISL